MHSWLSSPEIRPVIWVISVGNLTLYKCWAQENLPLCIYWYISSTAGAQLSRYRHYTCHNQWITLTKAWNGNKFLPLILILKTLLKFTFSSKLSLALCLKDFTSEPLLTYFFQIYCAEAKHNQLSLCLLSQYKQRAYDRVALDWFTLQFTTQARIQGPSMSTERRRNKGATAWKDIRKLNNNAHLTTFQNSHSKDNCPGPQMMTAGSLTNHRCFPHSSPSIFFSL